MLGYLTKPWLLWIAASIGAAVGLAFGLAAPGDQINSAAAVYLPGETTSGHYQIELKCGACHDEAGVVQEQKCLDCHEDELKASKDTHSKSKFSDPTKIVLLEKIAADNCLTCHREHDPQRTLSMGLTVPQDYCWHCHEDVADDRPSHENLAFDSCTNVGCHNYHDNTSLYENFLSKHLEEPNHFDNAVVASRTTAAKSQNSLSLKDADGPAEKRTDQNLMQDWLETAHALQGVNCSACHEPLESSAGWSDAVPLEVCSECHKSQTETFQEGKHGMRLKSGLSPMTPQLARLPMHSDAAHRELDCNTCHQAHRFDTSFAAVEACLQCHNDQHSNSYLTSPHYQVWKEEQAGQAENGSGVSCATCHMPRIEKSTGAVEVMHNQNWNLEPREKMVRSVCLDCHGVSFTLDSLASTRLIENCFATPPETHIESLDMVKKWFEQKRKN